MSSFQSREAFGIAVAKGMPVPVPGDLYRWEPHVGDNTVLEVTAVEHENFTSVRHPDGKVQVLPIFTLHDWFYVGRIRGSGYNSVAGRTP